MKVITTEERASEHSGAFPETSKPAANGYMDSTAFDGAMIEVALGCPVFPVRAPIITPDGARCSCKAGNGCKVPGKHPHITEWPAKATTDPAQIAAWARQWPGCNWGGITGKRAGRIIIETDARAGGDDGLFELERHYGPLPETRTYRSGSGGTHYVFAYPPALEGRIANSAGELAAGVDVRGMGGMGLLPGSLHKSGNRYALVDDLPIAHLPAAWLAALASKAPERSQWARTASDGPLAEFGPIMDGCRFMQHARDDAATLSEGDWFMALSIAANTEDGIEHAHELSEPYPLYAYEETQAKAERARTENKPMTCGEIARRTDGRFCDGCEHWGRIKSPIVLGRVDDGPTITWPHANAKSTEAPELHPAARYGLAGEVVAAFEPNTEADPAAMLVSFLVAFGSACGSGPHAWVAETRHGLNLAAVTVGATSRARKGTSWGPIARVFERADAEWLIGRKVSGIGSGEGIIWAIRDPSEPKEDPKTGQTIIEDQGIKDKRLMVHEAEFSGVLKVAGRDGSILSEIIRKAWDGEMLMNTVKRSPVRATSPHVSFLGHITEEELRRELSETAQVNGLANRFLWVYVRRSKLLPDAPRLNEEAAAKLGAQVRGALEHARKCGEVRRDADASGLWRQIYADLSKDHPGMFGALTARAEAQVLRLSMVYALLDRSNVVRVEHLTAALAFWRYCEDSARYIFGDRTGDPIADRIRAALRSSGPMTETDIRDLFGRHQKAGRIQTALELLLNAGLVTFETVDTGGRPARIWKAAK